jgi:hypothetical protein
VDHYYVSKTRNGTAVRFTWYGGEYIDVQLMIRGNWHAVETINVWDSTNNAPKPATMHDWHATCEEFLADGEFARCIPDYIMSVGG